LRGRLTDFYKSLRHQWWRRYLRGNWPWQSRWHHLAYYETPDADCAERLNFRGIIGRPFHEYVAYDARSVCISNVTGPPPSDVIR
jgi:hypothetical protein